MLWFFLRVAGVVTGGGIAAIGLLGSLLLIVVKGPAWRRILGAMGVIGSIAAWVTFLQACFFGFGD